LRADLTCGYFCRLLNALDAPGRDIAIAERRIEVEDEAPLLTSGYVQRGLAVLPRQSTTDPWRDMQDYRKDRKSLRHDPLEDGVLQFRPRQAGKAADSATEIAVAAE
jgi:hypothetical protein